jgi:serine/threonine protein kinase
LFLLAEAERAVGNLPSSRRRLAELLALDLHYPEARARLLALAEPRPQRAWLADSQGLAGQVERAVLPTVAMATSSRYQLLHELGSGRTGTVYRALDRELGCELALKVFHPHLRQRGEDETLLRVLHEARLLSAARHPGIVALYAVDGDELGDGKQLPLLAMELCQGGSLRARLREGLLPVEVVLLRTLELLETLAELHAGSVSHGDLKPENLLFRGDGRCRYELPVEEQRRGDLVIADFGLSRLGGGTFGAGLGTLGYLSRERFLGSPPAPAADVFAVGVILCELLLGELPAGSAALPSRTEPVSGPAILQQARLSHLGGREPALRQLLSTLLTEEASARPTAMVAAQQLRPLL